MEPAIILLDDLTDQTTKQMLHNVVMKKRKFEALEKKYLQWVWAAMAATFLLLFDVYFYIAVPYSYSFAKMFTVFVEGFGHFILLGLALGANGYMVLMKKKMDKAEKEYQGLRTEIISKSNILWEQEESWKSRHKVFEMMKKKFDINLYHENK